MKTKVIRSLIIMACIFPGALAIYFLHLTGPIVVALIAGLGFIGASLALAVED